MSYSLLLDTVSSECIVALYDSSSVVDSFCEIVKKPSTILHSEINSILERNNLRIEDIDLVIYASGPGSYTGMRLTKF